MNLEKLTWKQEWKVTLKVLNRIKENDELSKDFHMYLDIVINALNTVINTTGNNLETTLRFTDGRRKNTPAKSTSS